MGFQDIQLRSTTRLISQPDIITIGFYVGGYIAIRIGIDLMAKLGWNELDPISIAEGTDVDAGIIQLRRADGRGHGVQLRKPSKTQNINEMRIHHRHLNNHHVAITESRPSEPVMHQTFGGTLTVMLPEWIKPGAATPSLAL